MLGRASALPKEKKSLALSRKQLPPGILPRATIEHYQRVLRDAGALGKSECSTFLDRHNLARHGLTPASFDVPLPRFVVFVDTKEKGTRDSAGVISGDAMCEALLRMGVWAIRHDLETGDYAVAMVLDSDDPDEEEAPCRAAKRARVDDDDDSTASDDAPCASDAALRLYRVIVLLERKTRADMARSIQTGSRAGHRAKMFASGAPVLVWAYTENIGARPDGMQASLLSALFHDTFTLEGLDAGSKMCTLQLNSDADMPTALVHAIRRTAEHVLSGEAEQRRGPTPLGADLSHFGIDVRKRRTDPAATYAACLTTLVRGMGEHRAAALRTEFPTLLHLCEAVLDVRDDEPARARLVRRIADVRYAPVGLQVKRDKPRRIGNALADHLLDALIGPYDAAQ